MAVYVRAIYVLRIVSLYGRRSEVLIIVYCKGQTQARSAQTRSHEEGTRGGPNGTHGLGPEVNKCTTKPPLWPQRV